MLIPMAAAGLKSNAAGAFDPETDIAWHSLFWAGGSAFTALGLSDTDSVTTWPNETSEPDAATAAGSPVYDASNATFNSQPVVDFVGAGDSMVVTGATAVTYPMTVVAIVSFDSLASARAIFDGTDVARNSRVLANGTPNWNCNAGSSIVGGAPATGTAYLVVAYFSNSTSDYLHVNGATVLSGSNFGAEEVDTSFYIGAINNDSFRHDGQMALLGVYAGGNAEAGGSWADFETWVTSTYGITIA